MFRGIWRKGRGKDHFPSSIWLEGKGAGGFWWGPEFSTHAHIFFPSLNQAENWKENTWADLDRSSFIFLMSVDGNFSRSIEIYIFD
jgi:hypothetical protein